LQPCRQFLAVGIATAEHDPAVDQHQGQDGFSPLAQLAADKLVVSEGGGVLTRIESADLAPVLLHPPQISRDPQEHRIHPGAADPGRAAEDRIKDFDLHEA